MFVVHKITFAAILTLAFGASVNAADEKKYRKQVLLYDMGGDARIMLLLVEPCSEPELLNGLAKQYELEEMRAGFKHGLIELRGVRKLVCWRPLYKYKFDPLGDARFKSEAPVIVEIINEDGIHASYPMEDFKLRWWVY